MLRHKTNSIRKIGALVTGILWGVASSVHATLEWGNTSTNPAYFADGTTLLPAHETNWMEAAFIQLIYAGANQTNNPAVNDGQGVTGDDAVHDWTFLGQGNDLYADGVLDVRPAAPGLVSGGWYYARVWSASTPDMASGLVPSSHTNRYADSALFQYTWVSPSPPQIVNFGGASGLATTLIPNGDTDGDGLPDWWEMLYFGGITNAIANADGDNDQQENLEEYRAGTIPTNTLSVFALQHVVPASGETVLQWSSATGRTYAVWGSTNLLAGFESIATNLVATPVVNVYTTSWGHAQNAFFAIEIEPSSVPVPNL
jgi:hypothetical protein